MRGTNLTVQHVVVFLPSVSVGLPPGCKQSRNTPIHRMVVQETILKANLPPSSNVEHLDVNPRLFCGTDDATRGSDLQIVFGLSHGFFSAAEK